MSTTKYSGDEKLIEYALSSQDYIDQFIPIIKSELQTKNSLNELIEKLETIQVQKEHQLQDVSYESIDDISDSVNAITDVVSATDAIASTIQNINKELHKSGNELLNVKQKVVNYEQTKGRIVETNEKINSCLEILNLTNKILDLIKNEDFYRALILLKSLSNIKEMETFPFINRFLNSIPSFKLIIVEETFNQLNRWLNLSIEKNLTDFGELLFEHFQVINDSWFEKQSADSKLLSFKVNTPVEISFRPIEFKTFNPLDKLKINLQPLYHSILVFHELNQLQDLKEYISNDIVRRIDHLFIPIKDSITRQNVFPGNESLRINLFSICSFSITDRIMNEKTNFQIRSLDDIQSTFNNIQKKFLPLLANHIEFYDFDLNDLIEINDIFGIYYQLLTYYNFNAEPIYRLMLKVFKKFCDKSIEDVNKKYTQLSLNDNSQPLIIQSQDELNRITDNVFYISAVAKENFPITVPFSEIYVSTSQLLKNLIRDLYEFVARYYTEDNNVIINRISRSIDKVLINIVLKDLDDKIKSTYKEVVSQNLVNLDFYSSSIYEIENYLNFSEDKLVMRTRKFSSVVKLDAINEFKKARRLAIESMFNMIDSKVHSLFDMVDFNWESEEVEQSPNTGIIDLIGFLQDSFKLNFSHLPESIKSLLLLKILDKIAKFMEDSIFEVKKLNEISIKNFSQDIEYIEASISNFYDSKSNIDETLMEPLKNLFTKLQQIIELLMDGTFDNYKNDDIRMRNFNKIAQEEAVSLINKLSKSVELENETPEPSDDSQDDVRSIFGLKRSATTFTFRK